MKQYCFNITQLDINKRIDLFLQENLENISRSFIQNTINSGNITVCGKKVKKNYKLALNDEVIVKIEEPEILDVVPQNIPLDIIYEDLDIIVINKPKNMVVHPAPGHLDGTLVNALMFHCGSSLSGINGVLRPGIVHRIDKDTTGLLVVCKNDVSHISLSEQIKNHTAKRIYRGIVFGSPKEDEFTINAPIGRHKNDRKKMSVTHINSKEAITHVKVLERFNGYSYIEFSLKTGRTHQIRAHMQNIGHPLLGDTLYTNMKSKFKTNGQCLHAINLQLTHPKTNEQMNFYANLPEYFEEILNELRKQV